MVHSLLLLLLAVFVPALASAQATQPVAAPAPSVPVDADAARRALQVLQDPAQRATIIDALETIARMQGIPAAPVASAGAAAPAASAPKPAAPASTPATTPAPSQPGAAAAPPNAGEAGRPEPLPLPLAPDSLGAQVIVAISDFMSRLATDSIAALRTAKSIPSLWGWVQVMATDPLARSTLAEVSWRLLIVLAVALAVEWAAWRAIQRPRTALRRMAPALSGRPGEPEPEISADAETGLVRAEAGESEPPAQRRPSAWTLLRRLPIVVVRLLLDLLPILLFAAAGHFAAETDLGSTRLVRLVMLAFVDAYVACRVIFVLARLLLSPRSPQLRLVHLSDAAAQDAMRWIKRIVSVAIFGYAGAEVGLLLGMTDAAHRVLLKAVGFTVVVLLAITIFERRKPVARWMVGDPDATGRFASFRRQTARIWHLLAVFYLGLLWVVWAVELRNGFEQVFRVFVATIAVGITSRLLLILGQGSLDRAMHVRPSIAERYPGIEQRAKLYHRGLTLALNIAVAVLAILVLFQLWGLPALTWLGASLLGRQLLSSVGMTGLTVALALAVWEGTNAAIQRHLAKLAREAQTARSARLRTLLPLLRTMLFITVAIIVGLMVLSEIGLNIAPLLAGAGIVGVAIGFGSQKLVQDLITGIFLLLENAMQVGDMVTVSGLTGTVENLSVRTIRLRATDGSVHIIPFSSVTSVTNTNRGLGNASVSVTVPYHEDTDHVSTVLKEIAAAMGKDPEFASKMLSGLQLWGVDKVDGAAATILGQIVCTDAGRYPVQREFNRRLKIRFQELGIDMYNPVQTIVVPVAREAAVRPPVSEPHP
ncbi:MAG: mechanosensitive ion channel, partial [Acetobacteraceae bacterium]|nr:mechanosensitive ion channel [Acetobacteraceae bacterium]